MIERRTMLAGLAATAVGRAAAQAPPLRRIGCLSPRSARTERNLDVFRRGLEQTGFVEGRNLAVDYRYAEGDFSRLPGLAAELIRLGSEVVVASGGAIVTRAVRQHSATIPVVFATGLDPVADSLVESLNRPGGRTTGIWVFTSQLGPKRIELLREVVPQARAIGFLLNPRGTSGPMQERQMSERAGRDPAIVIHRASTALELDAAFAAMAERGLGGVVMGADTFFQVERDRLVALAARHRLPTMYEWPEFVQAGGLMADSTAVDETWVQLGAYAGRILKGEDPGSLPVVQSAAFVLSINLRTAKEQGIAIPPSLLARADEVIE